MKKTYSEPDIKIVNFTFQEILTGSDPITGEEDNLLGGQLNEEDS